VKVMHAGVLCIRGYLYAGLEFGAECYCGLKVQAPNASETNCNMDCEGDQSIICRGPDWLSIVFLEPAPDTVGHSELFIFSAHIVDNVNPLVNPFSLYTDE
jgi:hypothetical protein